MEWNEERYAATSELCALASLAFAFPTEQLAETVASGEFEESWDEAFAALTGRAAACSHAGARAADEYDLEKKAGATTFEQMRREYSRLYDLQGSGVLIWPYESCFLFRERGGKGMPGLFRTPSEMAVEDSMRRAGVQPVDRRTEPADSVAKELAFLSLLFGRGETGLGDARAFLDEHVLQWIPAFMEQTAKKTRLEAYRLLAEDCLALMSVLSPVLA